MAQPYPFVPPSPRSETLTMEVLCGRGARTLQPFHVGLQCSSALFAAVGSLRFGGVVGALLNTPLNTQPLDASTKGPKTLM